MLIMSMITYRIVRHEVQLPINQNYDKILKRKKTSVISFHKKQQLTLQNTQQQCMHMMSTVHLRKHDCINCPTNDKIRLVITNQV